MNYLSTIIQVVLIVAIVAFDVVLHQPFDWTLATLLFVATVDKAADEIIKEIKKLNK